MTHEKHADLPLKNRKLAAIAAERGLSIGGFRKDMRALVKEYRPWSQYEEVCDEYEELPTQNGYREYLKDIFYEWFGDVLPAAYRLVHLSDKHEEDIWDQKLEIYEVENSLEIPDWKLKYYGSLADTHEGPWRELHILDKYDNEIVIPQERLECFAFGVCSELKKHARSRAVAQHYAPVIIDISKVSDCVQDIIWGLGARLTHNEIAANCGIGVDDVKNISRFLEGNDINPRNLVKEKQARWKVAYDALRELGIET